MQSVALLCVTALMRVIRDVVGAYELSRNCLIKYITCELNESRKTFRNGHVASLKSEEYRNQRITAKESGRESAAWFILRENE